MYLVTLSAKSSGVGLRLLIKNFIQSYELNIPDSYCFISFIIRTSILSHLSLYQSRHVHFLMQIAWFFVHSPHHLVVIVIEMNFIIIDNYGELPHHSLLLIFFFRIQKWKEIFFALNYFSTFIVIIMKWKGFNEKLFPILVPFKKWNNFRVLCMLYKFVCKHFYLIKFPS